MDQAPALTAGVSFEGDYRGWWSKFLWGVGLGRVGGGCWGWFLVGGGFLGYLGVGSLGGGRCISSRCFRKRGWDKWGFRWLRLVRTDWFCCHFSCFAFIIFTILKTENICPIMKIKKAVNITGMMNSGLFDLLLSSPATGIICKIVSPIKKVQ